MKSDTSVGRTLIGAPLTRKEDHRFLTGSGQFADDIALADQVYATVVRSPHPHARIREIDLTAAQRSPGLLAILTASDIESDCLTPIPSMTRTAPFEVFNRDGSPAADGSQYPLARDKVRYLGEPVGFVVAETLHQARDAAERVAVRYETLPPIVEIDDALEPKAPRVWEEVSSNVSVQWESGDAGAVEKALAEAAHVTRLDLVNNRIAPVFMEPQCAIADHDEVTGRSTLWTGSQSAHGLQGVLAQMLGIEPDELRVVTPDTGGGFGARGGVYPEFALTLLAARKLARPVKWTNDRSESFLSDTQARDHVMRGELAMDAQGRFTGLRVAVRWRHGAYVPARNIYVMVSYLPPTIGGVYRIPRMYFELEGVFTNTTPQAAYRGIGRVEATYLIESLVDAAARESGIERIELRRRNMVTPDEMPWTAPGGAVYTSGEFERNMDRAMTLCDWSEFDARRERARSRGRTRGIGLAMYIENDGGAPSEFAEISVSSRGEVEVLVGTQDFGMGHETTYSQVVADELAVDIERVRVVEGDTSRVRSGFGSHGSRSARIGGAAVVLGVRETVKRGTALAAERLEAAVADVSYAGGNFTVTGTDREVSLFEVAAFAEERGERLGASADFQTSREVHANGCQACEVELDPETGVIDIVRYVVVADVGRAVNPRLVHGQLHGGVTQGIGQAVLERVVYDPQSGQTLSGTFMDYAIPKADDVPSFDISLNEVFEADNPLGVKGVGESGTTGAPAAVMNAIRNALADVGACELDMPVTPERVWNAIQSRR